MLTRLIICHLVGDFLLQNHWMQRKASSSFVCTVHVLAYAIPFVVSAALGLVPWWILPLILAQHWLQDRYALHTCWMEAYQQTPPDKWPIGPLIIDQVFHIAFIALFCGLKS